MKTYENPENWQTKKNNKKVMLVFGALLVLVTSLLVLFIVGLKPQNIPNWNIIQLDKNELSNGLSIATGHAASASDSGASTPNPKGPYDKLVNYLTGIEATEGIGSLLIPKGIAEDWKDAVNGLFENALFGGPAYWTAEVCKGKELKRSGGTIMFVNSDKGVLSPAAYVTAQKAQITYPNATRPGEQITEWVYKINFFVKAADKPISFNLYIDDNAYFTQRTAGTASTSRSDRSGSRVVSAASATSSGNARPSANTPGAVALGCVKIDSNNPSTPHTSTGSVLIASADCVVSKGESVGASGRNTIIFSSKDEFNTVSLRFAEKYFDKGGTSIMQTIANVESLKEFVSTSVPTAEGTGGSAAEIVSGTATSGDIIVNPLFADG